MSQYLRITSLLNDDDDTLNQPGTSSSKSSSGSNSRRESPAITSDLPNIEQQQQQQQEPQRQLPKLLPRLQTSSSPSQQVSTPTFPSTGNRHFKGENHVTREHESRTAFYNRYWPYTPHMYPTNSTQSAPQVEHHFSQPANSPTAAPTFAHKSTPDLQIRMYSPPQMTITHTAENIFHMRHSKHGVGQYFEFRQGYIPWKRQRRSRACQNCHTKKVKCEGNGIKCFNCTRTNAECKWIPMKKRGPKPRDILPVDELSTSSSATASKSGSAFPGDSATSSAIPIPFVKPTSFISEPEILEIDDETMRRFYSSEVPEETRESVVYYLDYFYGVCPIFHPATLVRRVVNGEVDPLLIDAMRASAARVISKHTGKVIDVDKIISNVQERLLLGLDSPSIDYVQAVVLITSLFGGECKYVSYNSLSCLSASLVTRLGWHTVDLDYDNTDKNMSWNNWLLLELKRRTFWVVYENDSYQSMLSDRPMTLSEMRLFVSAPGSDYTWDDVRMPQTEKWPTKFNMAMSKEEILRNGWVLHTFIESCNLTALISRVNTFLWDIKIGTSSKLPADRNAPNIKYLKLSPLALPSTDESIKSLFQYPEFEELHRLICEWRKDLIRAEDMKNMCEPGLHFSKFGSLKHRLFIMRIRYFSMYIYAVPVMHCLHFSNRPSYFNSRSKLQDILPVPASPIASKCAEEVVEDNIIRQILEAAFTDRLNDGLLAYDIIEESWQICVDIVHDLVGHFNRNSDIPLDRYDQVTPFCLLTSMTVLIRQIRLCRQKISQANADINADALHKIRTELSNSGASLRCLWTKLQDLGSTWRVEGIEQLLRTMQIEEVANAADLLSGLAL